MRGEYPAGSYLQPHGLELPPHARRIRGFPAGEKGFVGTTSACAENTRRISGSTPNPGNYLRMRGEYFRIELFKRMIQELPPHARRIPRFSRPPDQAGGTTSACAENTTYRAWQHIIPWNYLRMRGEYLLCSADSCRNVGTTSACAENTLNELGLL